MFDSNTRRLLSPVFPCLTGFHTGNTGIVLILGIFLSARCTGILWADTLGCSGLY